jgi:23S rRNA pseudouridine2605 synthase
MRTGNRRHGRSSKTSGTPLESEKSSSRDKRSSEGRSGKKPFGKKPYSRSTADSKKSFGRRNGGFQKDRPEFNKEGKSDRPSYRRDSTGRPPFRKEGDTDRPRFRKSDSDKPRFSKEGGRSYGERSGGYKKPYGAPRQGSDSGSSRVGKSDGEKPRFPREGGRSYGERSGGYKKPYGTPRQGSDSGNSRVGKNDGEKPRFPREAGRSFGERSGGYKKPYGTPRQASDSGSSRVGKSDGEKTSFRKEGGRSYGEKSGGYKNPYNGTPRDDQRESSSGDAPKWNRKEKHEFYGDRKRKLSQKPFRKNNGESSSREGREAVISDGSIRLNKYISNAGICSRREADDLIAAGVISVNGNVVTTLGYKVQPTDIVKYNDAKLKSEKPVYLLLNKPKDFITTVDDPQNRSTVMSLIRNACKERVYPVGRLDRNTTGLLLFTNDGDLADKLTHPSFEVQKVYEVHLDKNLKREDFEAISEGVQLEDGIIRPDEISYSSDSKSVIGIELHSGRNRIVRRIFEHFGYRVEKLDRVLYAGLTKKDLPRSKWRFLTDMELANLKMITGNKKFKAAPKRISMAEE